MKTIQTMLVLILMAGIASAGSLDSLRAAYSNAAVKVAIDSQKQKDDALALYGKGLGTILTALKQKGDIDGYTAVQQEQKRFLADKTVLTDEPGVLVADAVEAYKKQVASADLASNRRKVDLMKRYVSALGGLVKDMMALDKIEDAKKAGDEKKAIEFDLADLESSLPKVEEKTVNPWKDITAECHGGKKTEDGIVLVKERMQSRAAYRTPIEIEYVCKTGSDNIRLAYGCDQLIFDWEQNHDLLIARGGPIEGQAKPGAGNVPVNTFVTIRQVVLKDKMEIYVDGNLRASWIADFSKVSDLISVFSCEFGPTITVKSILVRVPEVIGADTKTAKSLETPKGTSVIGKWHPYRPDGNGHEDAIHEIHQDGQFVVQGHPEWSGTYVFLNLERTKIKRLYKGGSSNILTYDKATDIITQDNGWAYSRIVESDK